MATEQPRDGERAATRGPGRIYCCTCKGIWWGHETMCKCDAPPENWEARKVVALERIADAVEILAGKTVKRSGEEGPGF